MELILFFALHKTGPLGKPQGVLNSESGLTEGRQRKVLQQTMQGFNFINTLGQTEREHLIQFKNCL